MKRIIVFLLMLCLCVGLCACGEDTPSIGPGPIPVDPVVLPAESAPEQGTGEPIALTTGNWEEYLEIEVENLAYRTEELTPMGQTYATGYVDYEVRVRSKSDAYTFSDVVIKVQVLSETAEWTNRAMSTEMSLLADGTAAATETLRSDQASPSNLVEPELLVTVKKISGTVEVSK